MRVRILGSAAGGGLPQWNCRCTNCDCVRAGSDEIDARTQSSVAVSADGEAWYLLNVSPDIRQQILKTPGLVPRGRGERLTAIVGCVLTDAEIDHTSGLFFLREGCSFPILSTPVVHHWLAKHLPIEPVLSSFARRPWSDLLIGAKQELLLPSGQKSGLEVRAFELDPHVPRFVKEDLSSADGSVIGLEIIAKRTGKKLVYAPCVGSIRPSLIAATKDADTLLMDGTFWTDDEPIRFGFSENTARKMGHLPVDGDGGSLRWLAQIAINRRVYVHINNTNPMLNRSNPEYHLVRKSGVEVGADGDCFEV